MELIYAELLTVFFWALTYVLIVVSGFYSRSTRQIAMPYLAGVLNFAWEICAMIETGGGWVFVLWFTIDLLIVYFGFLYLDTFKKKALYAASIIVSAAAILFSFRHPHGYMYSVYLIDLAMAVCYLLRFRQLSPKLRVSIAVTKLLGDFFAGFVFGRWYTSIMVISVLVFLINAAYLFLCIKEYRGSVRRESRIS